jgi:cytochrome c oxidase cbb3-type subunit 3
MNLRRNCFPWNHVLCVASLFAVAVVAFAQSPAAGQPQSPTPGTVAPQAPVHESYAPAMIESGASLFQQNCAFCHGKDAGGGETGPDLTRSKLVSSDMKGEAIGDVVRNGRADKGMPRFSSLTDPQIISLAAFIHSQQDKAMAQTGKRKGVDVADFQTGNAEAGKQYFNGTGTCASCHSPTGDLAGINARYQGLQLEERMLYPKGVKSKVAVTTASGQTMSGTLVYRDEFTIALTDSTGAYHSWPTAVVKYKVDAPAEAHLQLLGKYTDDDIHNLMAYMQTLP